MLLKIFFLIAVKNVRRHWKRSLAAIVSISMGFIALVVFQGYMDNVKTMYYETFRSRFMYGDVMIENQSATAPEGKSDPWKYSLDSRAQEAINHFLEENQARVQSKVRFLQISGMIRGSSSSMIFRGVGYDLAEGAKMREKNWAWNAVYGVPLQRAPEGDNIVLGQTLAGLIGCEAEKKIRVLNSLEGYEPKERAFSCTSPSLQMSSVTEGGQLNAMDFNVMGIIDGAYRDVDSKLVMMDLSRAQQLMGTQQISFETVKFREPARVESMIREFNQRMLDQEIPVHMLRWENHPVGDMYVRTMNLLSVFRNFVVIIIVAIAGLSVFNTMVKVVKERTREVGTLQSLGFQSWSIQMIFLFEALLLAMIGCVIGSAVSILMSFVCNSLGITYKAGVLSAPVPFEVSIVPSLYGVSVLFLMGLAMLTTWVAARSTLSQKIADNLTSL
jgi:putative ABC transport system permease protein